MIQELNTKGFIVVKPAEGMWLYNGDVLSDGIYAPAELDLSGWKEISAAEADEIRAAEAEACQEEERSIEDRMLNYK